MKIILKAPNYKVWDQEVEFREQSTSSFSSTVGSQMKEVSRGLNDCVVGRQKSLEQCFTSSLNLGYFKAALITKLIVIWDKSIIYLEYLIPQ